jgi:two-component system, NtrC family, sensor kinase
VARRGLRHKLRLGLALVAGSILLLAGGTSYGLYTYYISNKINEKKLTELETANRGIITSINNLEPIPVDDHPSYLWNIAVIRGMLDEYQAANQRTVDAGHDPDKGEEERELITKMKLQLNTLEDAVKQLQAGGINVTKQEKKVRDTLRELRHTAEHLRLAIVNDIQVNGRHSAAAVQQSVWLVGFSLIWSILLVLTMLYYFRVWMFKPIRELQFGVQRVHAGNFSQPITLTSDDELQELADEFNTMVARLHAVYADLARQVNERSRQLVRSERMVSVGFLAAGVAHEINNPLASILFCSEALERRLQEVLSVMAKTSPGNVLPADAEVLVRYLKMVQQEALRCKDITQKLLDFSRTGERRKESSDITGLIRGVLEVAKHLPSSRGKTVTFEPGAYVVAPVNTQDLKSVILNLVVNALDSMEDGGRLEITLGTSAGYAEMVFTDTGCGMTPDVLQNIFEPFFTKSRTGKGTGLGLFISHQIVDQHGGTITATSIGPGRGSTFTVRIPLELPQGQTASQDSDAEGPTVLPFPGGNREAA